MVNRRFLRIKVMQALYGFFQSEKNDLGKTEKELLANIEKIYDLYIYLFALFIDVRHTAYMVIEDAKVKRLPTKEDLAPNTKFIDNSILVGFAENKQIAKEISSRKVSWQNDQDIIRKVFGEIRNTEEYKSYMLSDRKSAQEEKNFLIDITRNLIGDHELLNYWFEEKNIHWSDDVYIAVTSLIKTIEAVDTNGNITLMPLYKDVVEDKQFVCDLLTKCVIHNDAFSELISDKTKNWEVERIAVMDILLMKMALTEIMYFENIPIKVSLNEYIEVSKQYSTPKSKLFINGILDKIVMDLKQQNKIVKTGRGLLES